MADGKRRRGRPTRFDPEIGSALIDLVINEDVPIVHAARRLGLGPRTVYDWLQRAQGEGASRDLAKWADNFTQFVEWHREDERRVRYLRDREVARLRWQRFMASREGWWLARLGPERFWSRRLSWLIERGNIGTGREQLPGFMIRWGSRGSSTSAVPCRSRSSWTP